MMPASQAATISAPYRGIRATATPATISMTPMTYMASWPDPGTMSLIHGARYCGQSVSRFANMSSPNRIGATVNTVRNNRNAW